MVQEPIKARTRTVKPNEIYGKSDNQEQLIEEALSAIRKTGPAAALERCRMVADLIRAQLEAVNPEQFADTSSVSDLEAFLGRADAVLKTM
jgi:aspartate aminotransferase-like enzyme